MTVRDSDCAPPKQHLVVVAADRGYDERSLAERKAFVRHGFRKQVVSADTEELGHIAVVVHI
jgi:hypothetical protein